MAKSFTALRNEAAAAGHLNVVNHELSDGRALVAICFIRGSYRGKPAHAEVRWGIAGAGTVRGTQEYSAAFRNINAIQAKTLFNA